MSDELTGGRWVRRGGTSVWVPHGQESPRPGGPPPFMVLSKPTLAESAAQIVAAVEIVQRRGAA